MGKKNSIETQESWKKKHYKSTKTQEKKHNRSTLGISSNNDITKAKYRSAGEKNATKAQEYRRENTTGV